MNVLLACAATFFASYFTVLLLGLSSKIMRDDRVLSAFVVSWGITFAQTATTYIIAHVALPLPTYIWWAGWGGSLGIVSSHYLYKYLTEKPMKNRNKSVALYDATRRDLFACMETGNFDRARTVLREYEDVVKNDTSLADHSKILKTEIVAAYAVSL